MVMSSLTRSPLPSAGSADLHCKYYIFILYIFFLIIRVRVSVRVRVRVCVRVGDRVRVRVPTYINTCMHACIHTYIHIIYHIHWLLLLSTRSLRLLDALRGCYGHPYIYIYTYLYVRYIHTYVYIYIYAPSIARSRLLEWTLASILVKVFFNMICALCWPPFLASKLNEKAHIEMFSRNQFLCD